MESPALAALRERFNLGAVISGTSAGTECQPNKLMINSRNHLTKNRKCLSWMLYSLYKNMGNILNKKKYLISLLFLQLGFLYICLINIILISLKKKWCVFLPFWKFFWSRTCNDSNPIHHVFLQTLIFWNKYLSYRRNELGSVEVRGPYNIFRGSSRLPCLQSQWGTRVLGWIHHRCPFQVWHINYSV